MSAIKDGGATISLRGKEYRLLCSLNALDEMQERFGGYDKLERVFDDKNPNVIKDLRWLLTILINEGMDDVQEEMTEKQVGKLVNIGNLEQIKSAIYGAFATGVNGDGEGKEQENVDGEEGNREAAQE